MNNKNIKLNDIIVFKISAFGYDGLSLGVVSHISTINYIEVNPKSIKIFYHPMKLSWCTSQLRYNDIKGIIDDTYIRNPKKIMYDYPEWLI